MEPIGGMEAAGVRGGFGSSGVSSTRLCEEMGNNVLRSQSSGTVNRGFRMLPPGDITTFVPEVTIHHGWDARIYQTPIFSTCETIENINILGPCGV